MKSQPNYKIIKKEQKGKSFNRIKSFYSLKKLTFGSVALISQESGRLTSKQLSCFYQSVNKAIKKSGRIFLLVFPHTPITKKPLEVRMGKGKGAINHWVAKIKVGTIICEIQSSSQALSKLALYKAKYKLPLLSKIIVTF